MPYVAPATVVTATTITSAWGNSVKAATDYLANPPACRVYNNAAISLATTGVAQALTFNTEREDTANLHSIVTNTSRITVPDAGRYIFDASVEFAGNATGIRQLFFRINGTLIFAADSRINAGAGIGTQINLSRGVVLAAADYVEVLARQDSGGALNINASSAYSPEFGCVWVGNG